MPMTTFRCDASHQPVRFEHCINCAATGKNKLLGCRHSDDVLRAIVATMRKDMPELSVTELLECPRALWFKKKREYSAYPSRRYWAFRGTMLHKVLEHSGEPGDVSEVRLYATIAGLVLSGQPDVIRVRGKLIKDYKTCKVLPKQPNEDHIIQLSCYRWLDSKQGNPIGIERGEIVYMDMAAHTTFQVELWSISKTEEWIKERLAARNEALKQLEPPPFEKHFSLSNWKCGRSEQYSYCDVRAMCASGNSVPHEAPKKRAVKATSQ